MGIKSPKGKDVWNESTVKSILTNEKYKGCALLQKHYTADYLTKKIVRNDGAVPQYYVEDCHEAIIDPATFDRVQEMAPGRGCLMPTMAHMTARCISLRWLMGGIVVAVRP